MPFGTEAPTDHITRTLKMREAPFLKQNFGLLTSQGGIARMTRYTGAWLPIIPAMATSSSSATCSPSSYTSPTVNINTDEPVCPPACFLWLEAAHIPVAIRPLPLYSLPQCCQHVQGAEQDSHHQHKRIGGVLEESMVISLSG